MLAYSIIPIRNWFIHHPCGQLLAHYQLIEAFIHNHQLWCKITKFISFFVNVEWKSYLKLRNKWVDIPLMDVNHG